MRVFARIAAVAAAGLAAAPQLCAQCAMCYATAQAQDANAARHLDYAILALLIPSVSLFAGVFIAAMRRSGRDWAENESASENPPATPAAKTPIALCTLSPES